MWWQGLNWINLPRHRDEWLVLVNTVQKLGELSNTECAVAQKDAAALR
jgi:hypothetical protein